MTHTTSTSPILTSLTTLDAAICAVHWLDSTYLLVGHYHGKLTLLEIGVEVHLTAQQQYASQLDYPKISTSNKNNIHVQQHTVHFPGHSNVLFLLSSRSPRKNGSPNHDNAEHLEHRTTGPLPSFVAIDSNACIAFFTPMKWRSRAAREHGGSGALLSSYSITIPKVEPVAAVSSNDVLVCLATVRSGILLVGYGVGLLRAVTLPGATLSVLGLSSGVTTFFPAVAHGREEEEHEQRVHSVATSHVLLSSDKRAWQLEVHVADTIQSPLDMSDFARKRFLLLHTVQTTVREIPIRSHSQHSDTSVEVIQEWKHTFQGGTTTSPSCLSVQAFDRFRWASTYTLYRTNGAHSDTFFLAPSANEWFSIKEYSRTPPQRVLLDSGSAWDPVAVVLLLTQQQHAARGDSSTLRNEKLPLDSSSKNRDCTSDDPTLNVTLVKIPAHAVAEGIKPWIEKDTCVPFDSLVLEHDDITTGLFDEMVMDFVRHDFDAQDMDGVLLSHVHPRRLYQVQISYLAFGINEAATNPPTW